MAFGNMNFSALAQGRQAWRTFCANHPNFPKFLKDVKCKGMPVGTKVTISVEYPNGQHVNSEITVKDSDAALFNTLQSFL